MPQLTKGQKAVFNCPSDVAYGENGAGDVIPPMATLRFEVELLDFWKLVKIENLESLFKIN